MNKFYIWFNVASAENHYWSGELGCHVTDPFQATLYDTREEAVAMADAIAQFTGPDVEVRQQKGVPA